MKERIALAVLMLSMLTQANAQEGVQTMEIDLQTAIKSALEQNKQLQASALDRELYHQKVREARSAGLPQIDAQLNGTTYFGKSLDFNGMQMKMDNQLGMQATASWTFSMQQVAGVKLAKIAQQVSEESIESTELDVKANVTDTYYAVLVYERNLDILKQNLTDMEEIERHTKNMYDAGAVELTDVDQMTINVSTLKNSILSTQRSYESIKRLLILQMGVDMSTKITTKETIDQVLGADGIQMDTAGMDIENNISYKQLKLSQEINEQTLKLQKYAYIPTLTAAYQYTHNFTGGFLSFDHLGTLTLHIPVFSGFKRNSAVKQAKVEIERGNINMALLKDDLARSEEQCIFDMQTAIDGYNLQKQNLDVARRVLNNYKNKYAQGVLSSLNLTQANSNYLSAEMSYAQACITLMQAQTQLQKLYNSFAY